MPIAFLPGTTATLVEIALIERAISSDRPITLLDLTPGAGSSSYLVTTGPDCILPISPLTPKSSKTFSNILAVFSNCSSLFLYSFFLLGSVNNSR